MERLSHGALLLDSNQPASVQSGPPDPNVVACPPTTNFGYLFPGLQKNPLNRVADVDETGILMAQTLIRLGDAMMEPRNFPLPTPPNPPIASVYSYFGQFITHELVFEVTTKDTKLGGNIVPLNKNAIPTLMNARTTLMDLDSIYGPMLDNQNKCFPVPVNGKEMVLGVAGNSDDPRPGRDLKRETDPPFTALIGDRRNDSNLITSQMHLAFLRAHNQLVQDRSFLEAQKVLRQHFQWLVMSDYLPKVVDHDVLESVRKGEIDVFKGAPNGIFMPVEFSAAAFRFAHSMPRNRYHYNDLRDEVELSELFLPITQYSRLLVSWIIDWRRFIPGGLNTARPIGPRLVQPLFKLIDAAGKPLFDSQNCPISLAALDLLRGYLLGLPTGQAVAKEFGETALSATEIEEAAGQDHFAADQKAILKESGLSKRTPLWFYILAEAAVRKNGACLGRVGSIIVAGVLMALIDRSTDSILHDPSWTGPTLGDDGFDLAQLFKLAEVIP
jgi:hypothetical protein